MGADEPRAAGDENPHGPTVKTKRKSSKRVAFHALLFIAAALGFLIWRLAPELTRPSHIDPAFQLPSGFELASLPLATRFDFPLGSENGALAYNAQRFTENYHLGFRPNFDSHLVPAYRERASNTKQQQTDKDATSLPV